jgi:hypothetical protein
MGHHIGCRRLESSNDNRSPIWTVALVLMTLWTVGWVFTIVIGLSAAFKVGQLDQPWSRR